jgi:hypothetical protein
MLDDAFIWNLRRGEVLATEVEASSPDRKSWVGVYPFTVDERDDLSHSSEGTKYRLRWFEVPVSDLEERNYNLDGDEAFIVTCRDETVDSLDKVEALLSKWQISSSSFSFPYTCNYPI